MIQLLTPCSNWFFSNTHFVSLRRHHSITHNFLSLQYIKHNHFFIPNMSHSNITQYPSRDACKVGERREKKRRENVTENPYIHTTKCNLKSRCHKLTKYSICRFSMSHIPYPPTNRIIRYVVTIV